MKRQSFAENYLPTVSVDAIYYRLVDEESRAIFNWRYRYYKTRDQAAFIRELIDSGENSINRYDGLLKKFKESKQSCFQNFCDFLENQDARAQGAVLYGAGKILSNYIQIFESLHIEIKAICDTHKHGEIFGCYPIVTLDDALASHKDAAFIITTIKDSYQKEMRQTLLENGISEERIFDAIEHWYRDLSGSAYPDQYFLFFFNPLPNEVFIDAGCFDGATLLDFRKFAIEGYARIYGFEPNPASLLQTQDSIRENAIERVELLNKGLWDTSETVCFVDNGDGSSIIDTGSIKIETVALDDVVDPEDIVTLIKMDIEGAELNALRGASKIITRDKPRLAICVYHKPEDIVDIPSYILSLNPEYKLYLRHHRPFAETETVLYAV